MFKSQNKVRKTESLKTFFDRRHEWMVSGAATKRGKTLDSVLATKISGEEVKTGELSANKRSYAEKMDFSELTDALSGTPVQHAYGHTKMNELAKTRSIFGVDIVHYVLHSYVCKFIEPIVREKDMELKEDVSTGSKGILDRQSWSVRKSSLNSFDFADFNSQHELDVMELLHNEITSYIRRSYSSDPNLYDMVAVSDWIAKSFLNCRYEAEDETVYITKGMYSGNRATTLINTILNRCYLRVVGNSYNLLYGELGLLASYRTGDDVVMKFKDEGTNYSFTHLCIQHNLDANISKQMIFRGRCEYLRLMYYEDGTVRGSICRSIGSFINGNWESEVGVDSVGRCQALWEQCAVLMRRGLSKELCQILYEDLVLFYSPVIHRGWITDPLDLRFIQSTVKQGGLGLPDFINREIKYPSDSFDRLTKERNLKGSELDLELKCSNSYIKYLNKEVLPYGFKIDAGRKNEAIDILSKSTIGLELPKSRMNVNMSKHESEAINSLCRNTKYKEKDKDKPGIYKNRHETIEMLNRITRHGSQISTEMRRAGNIKRVDQIIKLVGDLSSRKKKELKAILNRGFDPKILRMNASQDRNDGGIIPPQFQSLISQFSKYHNTNYGTLCNNVGLDSINTVYAF